MKVRLIPLLVLPALTLSCTGERHSEEGVLTTLRAGIEQPYQTRTQLSEPYEGIYKTLWADGDAIGVFDAGSLPSEFVLAAGAGTNSGVFAGTLLSDALLAVYPYSICGSISGSEVSVTLPEEQTYREGNIPSGAYPMVAVSSDSALEFRNLSSILKVSMSGNLCVEYTRGAGLPSPLVILTEYAEKENIGSDFPLGRNLFGSGFGAE